MHTVMQSKSAKMIALEILAKYDPLIFSERISERDCVLFADLVLEIYQSFRFEEILEH